MMVFSSSTYSIPSLIPGIMVDNIMFFKIFETQKLESSAQEE
jgi:hypothetical protein